MNNSVLIGEEYNNVIFAVCQACLGKITDSILSISFEINKRNFNVIVITNSNQKEGYSAFELLKKDLEKEMDGFKVKLEVIKILEEDFLEAKYKILDHVIFLRNEYE